MEAHGCFVIGIVSATSDADGICRSIKGDQSSYVSVRDAS
jgi:hypothetical protein